MTNAEKFQEIFKKFATEVWAFPEKDFLEWLNAEYKEPTTKNDLAQERYQDLIDYFGDKETAKTILEDKKEFKAWLERLRWNVKRVDELARELEQLKETTKNDLGVDCIDRAELLKAIDTWDKFGFEHTGRFIREPKGNYVTYVQYDDMVNCVKGLPSVIPYMSSVTPQPCDDAISRKAVLEMTKSYNTDGWDMYTPLVVDVEDIEELPSVTPQEPRWISVSERLPEKAFGCIVTVEVDNILTGEPVPTVLTYVVGYDGETWNNADGIPIPYEVIAWMPLPKPYREV